MKFLIPPIYFISFEKYQQSSACFIYPEKKKITALQVSFLFLFSNIFSPKNWMAISDTSNKKHAEVRIDSSSTYPLTYPPRNEGLIKGLLRLTSHNTWSGKDNYLQLK